MSQNPQRGSGASTPAPSSSQTVTESQRPQQTRPQGGQRTLRLRGARTSEGRQVQWADDVVDNEGLGRKSSKVCCIYHKPKAVDESSDESSSSDSDISTDDEADADKKGKGHACGHGHAHGRGRGKASSQKSKRRPSPNAYEKVPKPKPKESQEEIKT